MATDILNETFRTGAVDRDTRIRVLSAEGGGGGGLFVAYPWRGPCVTTPDGAQARHALSSGTDAWSAVGYCGRRQLFLLLIIIIIIIMNILYVPFIYTA